jgi:hypothetical protein
MVAVTSLAACLRWSSEYNLSLHAIALTCLDVNEAAHAVMSQQPSHNLRTDNFVVLYYARPTSNACVYLCNVTNP